MRDKPYKYTEKDIIESSMLYEIPICLVDKIVSQTRPVHRLFSKEPYYENYSHAEYVFMLKGASIAYKNQELIGRTLPMNHPKSIAVSKMLSEIGVSIQYHPHTGMMIVEDDKD